MSAAPLLVVNPSLDPEALAEAYARDGRLLVPDVLTDDSAKRLRALLAGRADWGLLSSDAEGAPQLLDPADRTPEAVAAIDDRLGDAASGGRLAFRFALRPVSDAEDRPWVADSEPARILEAMNGEPFLNLVRAVTRIPALISTDVQATVFGPGDFLTRHNDDSDGLGWRVAYVLHLTDGDWRADWGGYLLFHDRNGDVTTGYRPRFNSLILFAVPQDHCVSYVPQFAPPRRIALSGWVKDV